jgi:hypothetical protein
MTEGPVRRTLPGDTSTTLKADHQSIQELSQAYESATDPRIKWEIAEEACTQLENRLFSPPVNEEIDSKRKTVTTQEALANILERAKNEVLGIFQDLPIEPPRWKPANRESYFLILGDGDIKSFQWHGTSLDQEIWNFGNCFRSRKDAERARDALKELLMNFHKHGTREMRQRD